MVGRATSETYEEIRESAHDADYQRTSTEIEPAEEERVNIHCPMTSTLRQRVTSNR